MMIIKEQYKTQKITPNNKKRMKNVNFFCFVFAGTRICMGFERSRIDFEFVLLGIYFDTIFVMHFH